MIKDTDSMIMGVNTTEDWHKWVEALCRATGQRHKPKPPEARIVDGEVLLHQTKSDGCSMKKIGNDSKIHGKSRIKVFVVSRDHYQVQYTWVIAFSNTIH